MGEAVHSIVWAEYVGECSACGVPMWIPANRARKCREDSQQGWYCCNGHQQMFMKSVADKLREEKAELERRLENEKRRRELAEKARDTAARSRAQAYGKLKAVKKRVKNGVCPCCKRTFINLQRHMATKHPDFLEKNDEEGA